MRKELGRPDASLNIGRIQPDDSVGVPRPELMAEELNRIPRPEGTMNFMGSLMSADLVYAS
jgi:hypothetical protein